MNRVMTVGTTALDGGTRTEGHVPRCKCFRVSAACDEPLEPNADDGVALPAGHHCREDRSIALLLGEERCDGMRRHHLA